MAAPAIGRKQQSAQGNWLATLASLHAGDRPDLAPLIDHTLAEIDRVCRGRRCAYGWSGGKDSQAIRWLAERAGITECVLVISDLEYPAFLAWACDHMPHGCTVVDTGQNYPWLAAHPQMLFPADSKIAMDWMRGVQHTGQARYCRATGTQVLLLGRRRADGNYVGPHGRDSYPGKDGSLRYSPLADWSHRDVLALIAQEDLAMAPCYGWPRGFQVGTGPWPARQWCRDRADGWREVNAIDPGVVRRAAREGIPGAREVR